jgi:hypothetical protein
VHYSDTLPRKAPTQAIESTQSSNVMPEDQARAAAQLQKDRANLEQSAPVAEGPHVYVAPWTRTLSNAAPSAPTPTPSDNQGNGQYGNCIPLQPGACAVVNP